MVRSDVNKACEELQKQYGDAGVQAGRFLRLWLSGQVPDAYPETIARLLQFGEIGSLFDAFRVELSFGTAGARGRVGYGPNRFNMTTVLKTVQGHCEYLKSVYGEDTPLRVVVANDVRAFVDISGTYAFLGDAHPLYGASSRTFARRACEVYAANGVTAYLADPANDSAVLSTPMLSFVIPKLQACGGINLSASHNPPDDNGIKVYDPHGGQLVPPYDQTLTDVVGRVERAAFMPFAQGLQTGLIQAIPTDLYARYVDAYVREFGNLYQRSDDDPPIVYTPLCGCGLTTAGAVLEALDLRYLVPPQQGPDGTFAAIPLRAPNPEVPVSAAPAKDFADSQGLGLVLSSDPDADRVGVEAKLPDGTWFHFDGNQIAAMVCYFLMLDPRGPQKRGLVAETLVTTRLLGAIVARARRLGPCWLVDDTLVGFKYLADVLRQLEATGHFGDLHCRSDQLVMSAEESHGLATLPSIRDKDSTPACMYVAGLYHRLRQEGRTLVDYYADIVGECGWYDSAAQSVQMSGAEGNDRKVALMASLRQTRPETLAGLPVLRVEDRFDVSAYGPFLSDTDIDSRDVIQYFLPEYTVTVRPSGTEAKLKVYCELAASNPDTSLGGPELLQHLRAKTVARVRLVCQELLARVDITLDEAGLRILDVVDVDLKVDFESRIVPALYAHIESNDLASLDELLAWLSRETSRMIPGGDSLVVIRPALEYLTQEWSESLASSPLLQSLRAWAE